MAIYKGWYKMKLKYLILVFLLISTLNATQNTVDTNSEMANQEMFLGKVLEVIPVPGFKYMKVKTNNKEIWVGIMDVPNPFKVSKGDKISYDISTVMRNYKSSLLNRVFKEVIFASKVTLVN